MGTRALTMGVRIAVAVAVALASGAPAHAQSARMAAEQGAIGTVALEISCAESAKAPFLRGLSLLHSFVWPDARLAFQQASTADPACAMAYWGEAMSYYDGLHEPPGEKDVAAAQQAVVKAEGASGTSDRERGYIAAARALFDGFPKPSRVARDRAYSDAMRSLSQRHPGEVEAAAFYAISLLSIARRGDPKGHDLQMQAAKILEPIFAAHRDHPGAAHYLIHAYDDSGERERGLAAARAYAKIAPAVTHALHMPTHIFAGLGMWDETIASNTAAFQASDRLARERGQPLTRRYYHGVLYWLYALLQQGRENEARALLIEHRPVLEGGDDSARTALHNLLARFYLETDHPEEAAAMPVLLDRPVEKAEARFVRGLAQVRQSDLQGAEQSLAEVRALAATAAAAGNADLDVRARILQVQAKQLEGTLLLARGRTAEGLAALGEAARIEDAPGLSWAAPDAGTGLPAHEVLGEALLRAGRRADAAREFERALKKTPGRRRSLAGLERARQASPGNPF